jgi:hypothetical protein
MLPPVREHFSLALKNKSDNPDFFKQANTGCYVSRLANKLGSPRLKNPGTPLPDPAHMHKYWAVCVAITQALILQNLFLAVRFAHSRVARDANDLVPKFF